MWPFFDVGSYRSTHSHCSRLCVNNCSSSPSDVCILPVLMSSIRPLTHCEFSHMDSIGRYTDFILGSWLGKVRLMSSPKTFALAHPAPPDNIEISSGMQCMCERGLIFQICETAENNTTMLCYRLRLNKQSQTSIYVPSEWRNVRKCWRLLLGDLWSDIVCVAHIPV